MPSNSTKRRDTYALFWVTFEARVIRSEVGNSGGNPSSALLEDFIKAFRAVGVVLMQMWDSTRVSTLSPLAGSSPMSLVKNSLAEVTSIEYVSRPLFKAAAKHTEATGTAEDCTQDVLSNF